MTVWRLSHAVSSVGLLAAGVFGTWLLVDATELPRSLGALPVVLALILAGLWVFVAPSLAWRRWRYDIGEEEIDLQRGIFWSRRTLLGLLSDAMPGRTD